jgi:hypothetical protein
MKNEGLAELVEGGGLENTPASVVLPILSRVAMVDVGVPCDVRAHSASRMQPSVQLIQSFRLVRIETHGRPPMGQRISCITRCNTLQCVR